MYGGTYGHVGDVRVPMGDMGGGWDPTGLGSKSAGYGSITAMPGLRMEDSYGNAAS